MRFVPVDCEFGDARRSSTANTGQTFYARVETNAA